MKIITAEQMRHIDRIAIQERGIPSLTLMERAGAAVADEARQRFEPDTAVVLAGKGNNGGDGFVAARLLGQAGVRCRVCLFGDPAEMTGDALANYGKLPQEIPIQVRSSAEGLLSELQSQDLIIDALLGTGIHGPVRGLLGDVIVAVNASRVPVLAVDIPSGLPSDGGAPEGPCIRAAATVTMGLPKLGMLLHPGVEYTGYVTVADLGFPRDLIESPSLRLNVFGADEIGAFLPERPRAGNKGSFGKPLILAGSPGMTGAAVLAARAAGRSGAGLVYCGVPNGLGPVFDQLLIEAVKRPIPSASEGRFDATSIEAALQLAGESDAVALGPGLSTQPGVAEFVAALVERHVGPLVLDADGLNALGPDPEILRRRPGPTIVTPHPGEMSRLIGKSIRDIQSDRLAVARAFAASYNVVVVLKGAQTVIAEPDGEIAINASGNTGLAKGGSGDVLTGLVAGLAAQGLDPARAAQAGVFLHGLAADVAARRIGVRAMTPSDVIDSLGEAFQTVEKAHAEAERKADLSPSRRLM